MLQDDGLRHLSAFRIIPQLLQRVRTPGLPLVQRPALFHAHSRHRLHPRNIQDLLQQSQPAQHLPLRPGIHLHYLPLNLPHPQLRPEKRNQMEQPQILPLQPIYFRRSNFHLPVPSRRLLQPRLDHFSQLPFLHLRHQHLCNRYPRILLQHLQVCQLVGYTLSQGQDHTQVHCFIFSLRQPPLHLYVAHFLGYLSIDH